MILSHFGMVPSLTIPFNAEFPNIRALWTLPGHFIRTSNKTMVVSSCCSLTINQCKITFPVVNWPFDFYMCTVSSTDALWETISIVNVSGTLFKFFFPFRKYYVLWLKSFWNHKGNTANDIWNSCLFSFYPHQLNSTEWRQLEFLQAQVFGVW